MKQITGIYSNQKEFQLEPIWASYIYSYVFIFIKKNKITDSDNVTINSHLLSDFRETISKSLSDLLDVSYLEPSINELQKYPTRFEKIYLQGKIFKVNYRMSVSGRLAYALFCLIQFIENAEIQRADILLVFN